MGTFKGAFRRWNGQELVSDWLTSEGEERVLDNFLSHSGHGVNVSAIPSSNQRERGDSGISFFLSLFPVGQRRIQDNQKVRLNHVAWTSLFICSDWFFLPCQLQLACPSTAWVGVDQQAAHESHLSPTGWPKKILRISIKLFPLKVYHHISLSFWPITFQQREGQ